MISVAATAAYDAFGAGYTVFKLAEMDKRGLDFKVATDFACYGENSRDFFLCY